MSKVKVWIDQDLCTGDGLCVEICPPLFEMHDDGLAYVKEEVWPTLYSKDGRKPTFRTSYEFLRVSFLFCFCHPVSQVSSRIVFRLILIYPTFSAESSFVSSCRV